MFWPEIILWTEWGSIAGRVSKGCNAIMLMIISKGKLILGLIPFMTYYFSDLLLRQFMLFQTDCVLAGNKYCLKKKSLFSMYPAGWWLLPWVSPLVKQRHRSERWALPLKRAPPVCLSQTHLHKKSSEHHLPLCHHFKRWSRSSANAAIISKAE